MYQEHSSGPAKRVILIMQLWYIKTVYQIKNYEIYFDKTRPKIVIALMFKVAHRLSQYWPGV